MDPIHILRRVFLRINSSGGYQTEEVQWYALNFSSNDDYDTQFYYDPERKREKTECLLKPPTPMDPISTVSMPWLNSPCTTCGSTIYAIINGLSIHWVEADEISSAGRHWRLFSALGDPAVHHERLVTEAVHLGDNIYLFGSPRDSDDDDITVAEVFSLSHKRIVDTIHLSHPFYQEKMKFPPDNGFFAVADHSGQRIIVGSFYSGIVFFLMPGSPIVHVLDASLPTSSGITFTRPVLFEETLYWIWINEGQGGMEAYDLSRRLFMSGPIIHLPNMFYVNSDFTPLLFHFCGDEFFLLWNDVADDERHTLVRCVRLRVCKMEGGCLEAYTLSEKKHLLLNKESALMDGVVLGEQNDQGFWCKPAGQIDEDEDKEEGNDNDPINEDELPLDETPLLLPPTNPSVLHQVLARLESIDTRLGNIERLEGRVDRIEGQVTHLEREIHEGFEKMSIGFNAYQAQLNALEEIKKHFGIAPPPPTP